MLKENRSAARVISLLEYLSSVDKLVSLHQIAQATELDKATLSRLLSTLEARGWVYRSINDGHYCLGIKASLMNEHRSLERLLLQLVSPIMLEMFEQVKWPSDLTVFDGERMSIIESTRRLSQDICHRQIVGFRPNVLDSAVGRAYLAFAPSSTLVKVLETVKSEVGVIYTKDAVKRLLEQIREQGYALRERLYSGGIDDHDTEISESIAMPICCNGQVVACINIIYVNSDHDRQLRGHYVEILEGYVKRISSILERHLNESGYD